MADNKFFLKEVKYEPNIGTGSGIGVVLTSNEMKQFMQESVGLEAVQEARRYAKRSHDIDSEVVMGSSRWVTNVTNSATNAIAEEYGSKSKPPAAPLGHVLNYFRLRDPNRRQQIIARLLGR